MQTQINQVRQKLKDVRKEINYQDKQNMLIDSCLIKRECYLGEKLETLEHEQKCGKDYLPFGVKFIECVNSRWKIEEVPVETVFQLMKLTDKLPNMTTNFWVTPVSKDLRCKPIFNAGQACCKSYSQDGLPTRGYHPLENPSLEEFCAKVQETFDRFLGNV